MERSDSNDVLVFYIDAVQETLESKINRICDRVRRNREDGRSEERSKLSMASPINIEIVEDDADDYNATPNSSVILDALEKCANESDFKLNMEKEDELTQEMVFSQIAATLNCVEEDSEPVVIEERSSNNRGKNCAISPSNNDTTGCCFCNCHTNLTKSIATQSHSQKHVQYNFDDSQKQRTPSTLTLNKFSQTEWNPIGNNTVATQTDLRNATSNTEEIALDNDLYPVAEDRNILIQYIENVFEMGSQCKTSQREDELILSQYFDTNSQSVKETVEDCSNDNVQFLLHTINDDIIDILKESMENAKTLENLNCQLKGDKGQMVLDKIYSIFNCLISDWNEGKVLTLIKYTNKHYKDCTFDTERYMLLPRYNKQGTKLKNTINGSTFRLFIYLLRKIVTLIKNGSYCTRREIYYQTSKVIKRQQMIDDAIADICATLSCAPWDIRIVASSKGLIYGNLRIIMNNGDVVPCNVQGGTLVPQNINEIDRFETDAEFVLVVEKDSIFQKFLDERLTEKLKKSFIMITGKGSPDINTRHLLYQISTKISAPIYILVDADPYGIGIYFTYRFGSIRCCHLSEQLAVPKIRWLGVLPNEITKLDITAQQLTDNDRALINRLLATPFATHFPYIKQELRILLDRNVKAEIEGLMKTSTFFSDYYLPHKFANSDYL